MLRKMKEHVLKVEGMSCAHCQARVKRALEAVEGVLEAQADFKKGEAHVKAGDHVTPKALVEAVNHTGLYKATPSSS